MHFSAPTNSTQLFRWPVLAFIACCSCVGRAFAKGVAGLGKAGGDAGAGGADKPGQQVPPEVYNALTYAGTAFLFTLSVPLILYGLNKLLNALEDCFNCGPKARRKRREASAKAAAGQKSAPDAGKQPNAAQLPTLEQQHQIQNSNHIVAPATILMTNNNNNNNNSGVGYSNANLFMSVADCAPRKSAGQSLNVIYGSSACDNNQRHNQHQTASSNSINSNNNNNASRQQSDENTANNNDGALNAATATRRQPVDLSPPPPPPSAGSGPETNTQAPLAHLSSPFPYQPHADHHKTYAVLNPVSVNDTAAASDNNQHQHQFARA